MAVVTICSDSEAQENKVCQHFHCFPNYLPWSDGTGCHDLHFFWMLSFKPAFSLSFFNLIKRLFSSSSISAIRVTSSAYLRLFSQQSWKILAIFLAILIPACASSSQAFHMIYSAYKLNRHISYLTKVKIYRWKLCSFPNSEAVHFSTCGSNCCFLTYIQVSQVSGKVVWYSYLFYFPKLFVIHTAKAFSVVNETEIDAFLKFSCFFNEQQMLAIWTLVSAFSIPVCTSGSSQLTYCWNLAWRILSITLLTCEVIANVQ